MDFEKYLDEIVEETVKEYLKQFEAETRLANKEASTVKIEALKNIYLRGFNDGAKAIGKTIKRL